MAVHIAMTVVVLQRFVRGERRWYWFAVVFHTLTNLGTVLAARAWGAVAAEGVVTVFGLCALGLILRFRDPPGPSVAPSL
jgi:uncharacterized membrane protein YhfC